MNRHPSVNLPESARVWPEGQLPFAHADDQDFPRMHLYLPSPEFRTGQSVLILPGGGYNLVSSAKEGHRPAQYLSAHGIAAAVLEYRHSPQRHPVPLIDAQRGLRLLRAWAKTQGLRGDQVGVMGFSAGGHLAGSLSTQPLENAGNIGDALDAESHRPDFSILIYPVVSLTAPFSHFGSRDSLLGVPANAALAERLSIEKAVTAQTPPMFLVHAQDDGAVPVANSLRLYEALSVCKIPSELHLYPSGGHGFGMAANHPWCGQMLDWLQRRT
jgi:acetyl esterase/lipase